jgi:electron transfer flavoprotein alpha subunit
MALKINKECIGCGTCADACPLGIIVPSGDIYTITDECIECRVCADSCPVNAIVD